jgi:hypothetical protein
LAAPAGALGTDAAANSRRDTTLESVLSFERDVVATLVGPDVDQVRRAQLEQYVDDSLRAMPEYLRAGVAAESVVLGTVARIVDRLGRGGTGLDHHLARWRTNPIDPIRQYVRMFESLVLFATHELAPPPAPPSEPEPPS